MFRDLRTQILLWTILPFAVILIGVAYLGVNSHRPLPEAAACDVSRLRRHRQRNR